MSEIKHHNIKNLYCYFIIIALLVITPNTRAQTDGVIAHYPISGNVNDESGNGNHGIVYGVTLVDNRNGVPSSAIYFDGFDNYIDLGSDSTLKPQLPITFAAWIKIDSPVNNTNRGAIFTSNFHETAYKGIFISNNQLTGRLIIAYGDGTGIGPGSRRSKYIDVPPYNSWFHFVGIIRNESDMNIYINGVDAGGIYSGYGSSLEYDNGPAYLGCLDSGTNGPPHYYKGYLDDIILYNRAITEQEIDLLYGGGCLLSGDVNDDGTIDLIDLLTTVDFILGRNPAPFNFFCADVNSDGAVNVLDIIIIIHMIL